MSPVASTRCLLSSPIASTSSADGASTGSVLLFPVAGVNYLSIVSSRLLSLFARSDPLSTVFRCFLSLIAGADPLPTVFGCFFFITGGDPLSTISRHFLSLIADSDPLSAVSGGSPLFFVLPAGSQALFQTSTPSHVCHSSLLFLQLFHSFLPFLPTPLAHNPTPFTGKRLFNQAFIHPRPITSIQQ